MLTQQEIASNPRAYFAYYGERGNWPIAYAIHRDSDTLERSNFRVIERQLQAIAKISEEEEVYAIERASHFLVGWEDSLLVNPHYPEAVALVEQLRAKIEDYPALDEEDWSDLEWEEASELNLSIECYREEHGDYCDRNRGDTECRCDCHKGDEDDE